MLLQSSFSSSWSEGVAAVPCHYSNGTEAPINTVNGELSTLAGWGPITENHRELKWSHESARVNMISNKSIAQ